MAIGINLRDEDADLPQEGIGVSSSLRDTATDWPLELRVWGGETKRGSKFHGTEPQLRAHLRMLNGAGTGGTWDVDRYQLRDFK